MRYLWMLLLALFTPATFAATSIFNIPSQDQSMRLLGSLFGGVGTLLSGPSQTVVMNVLKYFNNAALVLGGIIILYSLVVSTVNTANDGEMLGKKWNSVWIPIRSALGFALLLPTKAGYAIIQVIVLWVIVQGVGAADYLWTNTVSNPQNYSAPPQQSNTSSSNNVAYFNNSTTAYVGQVCQAQLAQLLSTDTTPVKPQNTVNTSTGYIQFGVNSLPGNPSICGAISFNSQSQANVQQLVDNLAQGPTDTFMSSYDPANSGSVDVTGIQNGINTATVNYINAQLATQQQNNQPSTQPNFINQTLAYGWISAGTFYMQISKVSGNNVAKGTAYLYGVTQLDQASLVNVVGQQNISTLQSALQAALGASCEMNLSSSNCQNYGQLSNPATGQSNQVKIKIQGPSGLEKWIMFIIAPIFTLIQTVVIDGLSAILSHWFNSFFNLSISSGFNPIISMVEWGQNMLSSLNNIFTLMMMTIFTVGMATYTCSCANPIGYTIGSVLTWIVPFVFVILMALWLFGSLTAYYVPMIPYILFTLGAISWLIAVVEAMVAAPLLALGILHPEGQHDIFGHANAGIMILASVFLRPALMIIGFWASYLMIGLAISLLNGGFFYMAESITGNTMTLWGAITFTGIYILLMLIVVNRAFSLIYVIPDRVLRWLAGPVEDSGVAQDLQQLKGGYEQQAQKMGQTGMSAAKAQRELAQNRGENAESKEEPTKTEAGGKSSKS